MLKSTLLDILRTFNKEQLKNFGLFLNSPYHNRNSNVLKLFNSVKSFYPAFDNKRLQRELLWKSLFPGREFRYGVMKNLIFELQKLSEKFLSLEKFGSNEFEFGVNLLDAFLDKDLKTLFYKNTKYYKSRLIKSGIDVKYFYYKYIFESKELNQIYLSEKKKHKDVIPAGNPNESLLIFFFISFFNSNYNSLHESVLYNSPYDKGYLDSVIDFCKNSPVKNNKYVSVFSSVINTLLFPDDERIFYSLKKSLKSNSGKLSSELIYNVFTALANFCTMKMMKGNSEFIKEQFGIYKLMIESGNYSNGKDNYINPYMYANIVSMAANLRQFSWAERFIEKFKNKLEKSRREQCFPFAMVSLNLKRKRFGTALEYLSRVKSGDVIDKITIRRFQMMLYYESGYLDELHSLIDATRHFIANDRKTSVRTKNIFNNFLYFVNKFTEIKGNIKNKKYDGYFLDKLRKQINERELSNKTWILEKLEELENFIIKKP